MLENLNPAQKIEAPKDFRPAIEFDGETGVATLPAVPGGEAPSFEQFLLEQGFDPSEYEIVGAPRTSRWQKYDGDWLTSYRFNFRKTSPIGDLKLLWSKAKPPKKSKVQVKADTALVVMLADYQLGKSDHRGGAQEQLGRILSAYDSLEERFRKGKYEQIIFAEMGDIVEGFSSKMDQQQLATNTMSLMDQVDLATTLTYEIIKRASKYSKVTYATVASNHCQNRINKQAIGLPGNDDWGIFIAKQLHRLSTEVGLALKILIPQPSDETLAVDVFDDQFHVLGLWHGHQSARPDAVPLYWQKASFNQEPIAAASIGLTGHFHHHRTQELGLHPNGGSRYWVMGKTMDNGSSWFKLNGGMESQPGITCFELEKGKHFTGSVFNV
jgi:hypothetical protein